MIDYKSLLKKQNESWQEAINRYLSFCEADMRDYFPDKDSYRFKNNNAYVYHYGSKIPEEYLSEYAENKHIKIPLTLEELLVKHGTFVIGNGLFEIFDRTRGIMTLKESLIEYNYLELLDKMKPDILKSINQYYFFFGISFPQTEETSFLFFNKAGNFGKMRIDNTNPDAVQNQIFRRMFNGTMDQYSLDNLISNQMDRIIINALTVRGYIN